MRAIDDLSRIVQKSAASADKNKTSAYDATAEVVAVEGNTAYVHIPGGVERTPAKMVVAAKQGDSVRIRVSGGSAYITGNATSPPTDDSYARKAETQAIRATQAADAASKQAASAERSANSALKDAETASASAMAATKDAATAKESANQAISDAATAKDAADTAKESADSAKVSADSAQASADQAIADAGMAKAAADKAQEDAEAAQASADEAQANLKAVVRGAATVEKAVSVMQTALEAVVDYDPETDTAREYFWHDANGSHVLGAESGYRSDIDSAGMRIVDTSTEEVVSEFGAGLARIGRENEDNITITDSRVSLVSGGNETAYLDDQRFKSSDIVATNLYMQTVDASTGSVIGQIGWVMRSSGHLSLKLIR